MNRHGFFGTIVLALILPAAALAQQQAANQNIRGTITGFDGKLLSVKSREGVDLKLTLPDNANVSVAKAFTMAEIKPSMMLAVTTLTRADGSVVALDVRPLPATANGSSSP